MLTNYLIMKIYYLITANVKQIKVKVKRDPSKKEQLLKVKGKTSIRTMIKAAKSRD